MSRPCLKGDDRDDSKKQGRSNREARKRQQEGRARLDLNAADFRALLQGQTGETNAN